MSKGLHPAFHVLIPAAGSGTRTGASLPKQYTTIGGKMVLRHTIEKFLPIQGLNSLRVIIDAQHRALYDQAVQGLSLPDPVVGGATRKQSVAHGLSALKGQDENDIVLIHDAARPFIQVEQIESILQAMQTAKAATLAAPVADTLVDRSYNRLDRNTLRIVQTPQAFRIGLLQQAHETFKDDDRFTDDAGLIAETGVDITLVEGSHENFKITSAGDMRMAEKLLTQATETRTGMGYDVHEFEPSPNGLIRLGGIDIPHPEKLKGHSDADVILHALTDALLGTIGEGDIGQLFPPSDMQWKNADSEIFLKEAARRIAAKGGKIINADITVICETPKIGPHRESMQKRISDILGLTPSRIGLKATTSEGLGFTGRREGIVAQAVATVTLPVMDAS
jgi:2-C-methyl-D-erythritol 4-phosphate cytidylyltransferase / 2-C-methyl-D-erythritol 2,4-cyclodiphosphate synthase